MCLVLQICIPSTNTVLFAQIKKVRGRVKVCGNTHRQTYKQVSNCMPLYHSIQRHMKLQLHIYPSDFFFSSMLLETNGNIFSSLNTISLIGLSEVPLCTGKFNIGCRDTDGENSVPGQIAPLHQPGLLPCAGKTFPKPSQLGL